MGCITSPVFRADPSQLGAGSADTVEDGSVAGYYLAAKPIHQNIYGVRIFEGNWSLNRKLDSFLVGLTCLDQER